MPLKENLKNANTTSVPELLKYAKTWQSKVRLALEDSATHDFVKKALVNGYKNLKIKNPEILVSKIFQRLNVNKSKKVDKVLEDISNTISSNLCGKSVREIWSEYYRNIEAPFITQVIRDHVIGNKILEVGVGRGWISYNLLNILDSSVNITQTDLFDYRESRVKKIKNFNFIQVSEEKPFPFYENSFDTAIVVYVLHHLDSIKTLEKFLRRLNKITKRKIIILDDTYTSQKFDPHFRYEQSPLIEQFQELDDWQKICALTFSCSFSNRVDGGGINVSPPNIFMEFSKFKLKLESLFDTSLVKAEYLGIPRTKVYLNSEGIFIIEKL